MVCAAMASAAPEAAGGHTSCNQYSGTSGSDTIYGTNGCDEIWTYEGPDNAYGYDNPSGTYDELHTGAGNDGVHGGDGADNIYPGDNPTDTQEVSKAGTGADFVYDHAAGPDWDLACGGEGQDYLRVDDGDTLDKAKGEANPYGHEDAVFGDSASEKVLDGTC